MVHEMITAPHHLLKSLPAVAVLLCAACNFNVAQSQERSIAVLPCPSVAGKLSNLELKNISTDALPYLMRYSLPVLEGTEFCRYLERIQRDHEIKVEEGVLDMMGDYFLTTQKMETGYYFSYKVGFPNREIPKIILDGASSEAEQADLFLKAIERDRDPARKALLEKRINDLSPSNRREGALKLIQLLLEKSWVFNSAAQQYLASDNYRDDSYGFVDRGLRTTSYAHMGATVDLLFNDDVAVLPPADDSAFDAARKQLPETAKRILIIGPGLDFSHPEIGEEIPQQSYEPFAILDILLKSKRSQFEDIKIDLFDISPRVVQHWKDLVESANRGNPYRLGVVSGSSMLRGGNELSNDITLNYIAHFGSSLPGMTSETSTEKSRRPAPRTLDSYSVSLRTLTMPVSIVKTFQPFQGDLTTTDLAKLGVENGGKYDLVFCFNTMEYLNESERALAGINIREALAENGVFITDNRFETDSGGRPQQPQKDASPARPIFAPSFFRMVTDLLTPTGRHLVLYRKGQN